ncbi:MAG: T9SS type A sorting domain-containing protein, partial [Chitinophagaceae bacterium]|nr:T9SS type A sorting domain-containing protein [Chitinophagaceae bacterium]
VTDGVSIINLTVLDCGPVLSTDILSFYGRLENGKTQLNWSTSLEEGPISYFVERSFNGTTFTQIGEVHGYVNNSATNYYQFTEADALTKQAWYRITLNSSNRKRKHSQVISLKPNLPEFEVVNVINPFKEQLRFDISLAQNTALTIELYDNSGRLVRREKQLAFTGVNSLKLDNTGSLAPGVYTLRITDEAGKGITKRVMSR